MYLIHDANNSKEQIWVSVENYGRGPVWDFSVYGTMRSGDMVVCPSIGMACEKLGIDPKPILKKFPCLANDGPREAA